MRVELFEKAHEMGVAEEDGAVLLPERVPAPAADETADTRELTAEVGREAVGLAAIELRAEDNAGATDAEGLAANELIAEERAGAAVTAGCVRRDERREETAGLPEADPPTDPPTDAPAVTPAAGEAATEDAAFKRDETAAVGTAAAVLDSSELRSEDTAGATDTLGLADK